MYFLSPGRQQMFDVSSFIIGDKPVYVELYQYIDANAAI